MIDQPAQAFTDLVLGLVATGLAIVLQRRPGVGRHWRATMWWTAAAALAGAAHHAWLAGSAEWSGTSWSVISGMVVVAVSYLLAATVEEVLGPGHARAFWLLRSAGLLAYAGLALAGRAGIGSILLCEGVTMICILALWGVAAFRRLPLARPVIAALAVSGLAGAARAMPDGAASVVGLDPTSVYHLLQIPGLVMLAGALLQRPVVTGRARPLATRRAAG